MSQYPRDIQGDIRGDIRGETREMGRCILDHREAILEQWERRSCEENPDATDEHRQALLNRLPQFIERLGETLSAGSALVPRSFAIQHGIQRWELGWDVASLSRDYMVLRRVLIAHLQRCIDMDTEDVMALSATLDEAVAESVSTYVAHRERELLEKNEALQRHNHELKRFAHLVGHEVRNPLGLITMAASALRRALAELDPQPPGAARALERIDQGHDQIVEVLDSLSRFALGDSDEACQDEAVDLEVVCDEALDRLRHAIQTSGATVTREPLPTVRGSAVALRAVFQNLIENAIKYAGDAPPRIRVWAHREPAADQPTGQPSSPPGPVWAIAFRDEGIGISPQDQTRIFQFLQRVNIKSEIAGTGVGLALCRRVAEQHGGTITVESQPGRGSTFTLRLPAEPVEADAPRARGSARGDSGRA